jgi:hypothetical protein
VLEHVYPPQMVKCCCDGVKQQITESLAYARDRSRQRAVRSTEKCSGLVALHF